MISQIFYGPDILEVIAVIFNLDLLQVRLKSAGGVSPHALKKPLYFSFHILPVIIKKLY